jgi:hypothetical protein
MVLSLIPDSGKVLGDGPGWGWGWAPDPRQIGGGTPVPDPRQIGDGDGDGDRGLRALSDSVRGSEWHRARMTAPEFSSASADARRKLREFPPAPFFSRALAL